MTSIAPPVCERRGLRGRARSWQQLVGGGKEPAERSSCTLRGHQPASQQWLWVNVDPSCVNKLHFFDWSLYRGDGGPFKTLFAVAKCHIHPQHRSCKFIWHHFRVVRNLALRIFPEWPMLKSLLRFACVPCSLAEARQGSCAHAPRVRMVRRLHGLFPVPALTTVCIKMLSASETRELSELASWRVGKVHGCFSNCPRANSEGDPSRTN